MIKNLLTETSFLVIGYLIREIIGHFLHASANKKKLAELIEQTKNQDEQTKLLQQIEINTRKELG